VSKVKGFFFFFFFFVLVFSEVFFLSALF